MEFDLELAKSQSSDNPVYYVQYAHARVASMLERMREQGMPPPDVASADFGLLTTREEESLMRALSRYPEVIELAAQNRAPQHVVHYLRELAAEFHQCYNAHRVLVDETDLRNARVALAITPSDVGYPFFGPALDRRLDLLVAGSDDAPGATWAFVSPSAASSASPALCTRWRSLTDRPSGWRVYRRAPGAC